MMIDLYLRADSEAAMRDALAAAGFNPDAVAGLGWALDMVGIVLRPTGETTQFEDIEVPVLAPVAGWHANLRLLTADAVARAAALAPITIPAPATPDRAWV